MHLRDLVLALRSTRRRPASAGLALVLAALAVGLQAVLASVLSALLVRPLPYAEPERLVLPWGVVEDFGIDEYPFSWPNYLDYRALPESPLVSLSATRNVPLTLSGGERPRSVEGARVTLDLLETLGISPQLGAWFDAGAADGAEGLEGAAARALGQVVISDRLWRSEWQASPDVVGSSVRLDGDPHLVVGVLPPAVRFPNSDTDLWIPLVPEGREGQRAFHFLRLVGRLAPGRDLDSAQEQLAEVAARLAADHPDANDRLGLRVVGLRDQQVGRARPALGLLALAVQVLFLVACINLAGLSLARSLERSSEVALRLALGASRRALLRTSLSEGLIVAVGGGAAGLIAAWAALRGVRELDASLLPLAWEVRLDPLAMAAAGAAAVVVGGAVAAGPAWSSLRRAAASRLVVRREAGRRGSAAQRLLVVAQVAVGVPLLLAALAAFRHIETLTEVELGYPLRDRVTAGVALPLSRFSEPADQHRFVERARQSLAAIPAVESVGAISRLPLSAGDASLVVSRPDREIEQPPNASYRVISSDLVESFGLELVDGRALDARDDGDAEKAVVVDQLLAAALFPEGDAVGRVVRMGAFDVDWTVVGVVRPARLLDPNEAPRPAVFVSILQNPVPAAMRTPRFVARVAGRPAAVVAETRRALQQVDPEQAVLEVRPMQELLDERLAGLQVLRGLLSALAFVALLLSGTGLFAVLRASVERRRFEFGVRAALGAGSRRLRRRVLGEALTPVAIGAVLGVALSVGFDSALRSTIVTLAVAGERPWSAAALTPALLTLAATALLAGLAPAVRAGRTDPTALLRESAE